MEAQVAMGVIQVKETCEFTVSEINIAQFTIQKEHQSRLRAFSRSGMDLFLIQKNKE